MAPKENQSAPNETSKMDHLTAINTIETRSNDDDTDERSTQTAKDPDWKQRLLAYLRQSLKTMNGDPDSTQFNIQIAKKRLLYATAAAIVATCAYRYRNQAGRRLQKLLPLLLALLRPPEYAKASQASMSLLRDSALAGSVPEAMINSSAIVFRVHGEWRKTVLPPNSPRVQAELMDALSRGGCPSVSVLPESLASRLAAPVLAALPFIYLGLMYKMLKSTNGAEDMLSKLTPSKNKRQQTTFRDVAGLPHVIPELREIVTYLDDPPRYQNLGANPPRGVLLYGPPGTGKTLLARAVAGEADCDAFLVCSGSDFCEMYVGRGSARVRALFRKARQDAYRNRHGTFGWFSSQKSDKPATAIIFIDELDALAKSRSYGAMHSNDERDQTLNQLLTEMDGFQTSSKEVTLIVIAASNRADVLDPAILRRFDRQIQVGNPDEKGRKDILQIHARSIPAMHEDVDWDHLAGNDCTADFSGSDLRVVINDAALLAARESSSTVSHKHIVQAVQRLKHMKKSVGKSTATMFRIPDLKDLI